MRAQFVRIFISFIYKFYLYDKVKSDVNLEMKNQKLVDPGKADKATFYYIIKYHVIQPFIRAFTEAS